MKPTPTPSKKRRIPIVCLDYANQRMSDKRLQEIRDTSCDVTYREANEPTTQVYSGCTSAENGSHALYGLLAHWGDEDELNSDFFRYEELYGQAYDHEVSDSSDSMESTYHGTRGSHRIIFAYGRFLGAGRRNKRIRSGRR